MVQNIKADIKFGKNAERIVKPILEEIFGELQEGETFDNFDFYNDNYYVEHKQRNVEFGRYNGLFFDTVKYNKYLQLKNDNPDLRFFIVWSCRNGRYIWEFSEVEEEFNRFTQTRNRGRGVVDTHMINVFNNYIKPFNEFSLEN